MKPVKDSVECPNRGLPDRRSESNFRWVLIIVSLIFLPLGILLSVSVAKSQSILTRENTVFSSRNSISPVYMPTPVKKQSTSKLRGYVYDTNGVLLPKLTITFTNNETGLSETYHTAGKFSVPLQNGQYNVRIRDGKGHLSRYYDIEIASNTSIKFSFGNYVEPVTPVLPTPYPTTYPSPIPPTPKPSPPKPDPVTPTPIPPRPTPDPKVTPEPDNSNSDGNSNTDGGNANFDEEANANTDRNSNSNTAFNSNSAFRNGTEPLKGDPSISTGDGFFSKLSNFVTENPIKVTLTILAAISLAALALFGLPGLASLAAFFGSLLAGLGLAGKTDEVDDDVQCTLYSTPEVREGSDLLVQVFAHLLEQADGLDELAKMLDPEAKKQLSKSLSKRIKRDSVLTFKLMIPGVEFEDNEHDIVWRGEPDSVEFIVPIPPDHGDGNRFGRVFVYQNGEELGKISFRITVVSKAKPIAVEKISPSAQGIMTQNETAFVSYASKDKDHVYRFVQLMDVLKYEYHIDVFSIEAGDRWENKLYEFIDTDEVFLLFWSESASQSEWVIREAKRAEERAKSDPNSLPRIIIYRLDEKVSIPEWLQEFHVDRKWAGMIANIKEKSASAGEVSLP